jgi:hypothetical protein
MIEQASLVIGNCNWANKEGSLLGYKLIDGKYYPREMSATRATTATRINAQGLVELVPYNLLQYSEQFDNAAWGKVNATITANATTAPDGTLTADKFESVSSSPESQFFQTINSPSNTISLYAKAGNINTLNIWIGGLVSFNLSTGVVTAGTATMENAGNGWWRCIIPTTYNVFNPFFNTTASGQFVYVWGAQAVEGSTAKDYQKTETRLNIPRLDYSNGTCPSLLVEPQRTNLVTYSSSFDNAAWVKLNGSVTANIAISPSGIQDADSFIPNTTSGFHALRSNNFNQSSTASHSWFLKANGYSKIAVRESDLPIGNYASFDLSTGTLISTSQSGIIEDYGNGWYRCTLVDTNTGAGAQTSIFVLPDNYTTGDPLIAWSGDGIKGVFAYGAQAELGSYPTSYIPTTSASVTRNADVISKTGISSLIGQTEGTLFWEGIGTTQSVGNDLSMFGTFVDDTSVAVLLYYVHSSGYVNCYINNGSSFVNLGAPLNITNNNKIAVGYKNGDFAMYANGTLLDSSTSATAIPSGMNQVAINKWLGVTGVQKQQMKAAALWTTRLTNAQLQQLSSI